MSLERPSSHDNCSGSIITEIIEPQNMVLSDSGHLITVQQQQQQTGQHRIITTTNQHQPQQIIVNGNSYTTLHTTNSTSTSTINTITNHHRLKTISPSSFTTSTINNNNNNNNSSPKYVVFHQNGTSQYATVTSESLNGTTYITTTPQQQHQSLSSSTIQQQQQQHQSNGIGNIVVLATEPLDINHQHIKRISTGGGTTTTDEDLTSLSWLHDKNLINNIVSYSNNKSETTSPIRQSYQSSNEPLSPTSDFLEDSCISEDNASSANSSSDQGISIHSSDFSPTMTTTTTNNQRHQQQQQQQQHHQQQQQQQTNQSHNYSVHHHIQYANDYSNNNNNNINNNNNNNNSINSKNRNQLLSPTSSTISQFTTTATTNNNNNNNDNSIINGNSINMYPPGATTTVHVGPSGTTTVVEYKSGSNFITSPRHSISQQHQQQQQQVPSSPQRIPSHQTNQEHQQQQQQQTSTDHQIPSSSASSSTPTTTTTYHQQHFHKKYLREQLNGGTTTGGGSSVGVGGNNFDNGNHIIINNNANINNQQDQRRQSISPINSVKNHLTFTQSTNSQSTSVEDYKEYQYSTPTKTQSTIINSNQQDDLIKDNISYESQQSGGSGSSSTKSSSSLKQKHPTNIPYDPHIHTHNKPPYSFSSLIFMAIEDSPEKALPVKEIYAWIVQHFPYFKTAPTGWKNSVRHNLSLNKSFLKVEKAPNMGKGSLWRVEQNQRPNLIQALTRSPFFPCAAIDKLSPQLRSPTSISSHHSRNNNNNNSNLGGSESNSSPDVTPMKTLDAKLFPKLSKMIKEMVNKGNNYNDSGESGSEMPMDQDELYRDNHQQQQQQIIAHNGIEGSPSISTNTGGVITCNGDGMITPNYETIERLARDCGADNDDVNAAAAMLALKHGPKVFTETFSNGSPVITSSPSEDHTYSAGNGGTSTGNNSINTSENNSNCNSSSDSVYDSREGSPTRQNHNPNHNHITPEELEERRRHAEGVDALLSFASRVTSMSSSSSTPMKRSSSISIEDEHLSSYVENIPSLGGGGGGGIISGSMMNGDETITIMTNGTSGSSNSSSVNGVVSVGGINGVGSIGNTIIQTPITFNQKHQQFNTTDGYYNHILSPSPAKKIKTSKNLRTKIKRKATWIR